MTEQGRRPPRQEDSVQFPLRPRHEHAPGETEAGDGISVQVREGTDLRPHPHLCSPVSQAGDSQEAVLCEKLSRQGSGGFLLELLPSWDLGSRPPYRTALPTGTVPVQYVFCASWLRPRQTLLVDPAVSDA